MIRVRRFSTWIHGYAGHSPETRLEVLCKQALPRYKDNVKEAVIQDLSRNRHAMQTAFAVRADISSFLSSQSGREDLAGPLKALDKAVQDWLAQTLSLDLLEHKRITFDHSSGYTLERVARSESVHRVRNLSELKRRLHDGKRCFGFFHPSLGSEPLVFVHVGLTTELAGSLRALDTFKSDCSPTHAMFYSINSPHTALRGLDIASLLIKETAQALRASFPSLHTFSTLSPIPKFCDWMLTGSTSARKEVLSELCKVYSQYQPAASLSGPQDESSVLRSLADLFTQNTVGWATNEDFCRALESPLLALAAHYLAVEKRQTREGLVPIDDVGRFHLRNGAVLHAINWMGNPSKVGLTTSAGMMVNYLYDFAQVESNAEKFGQPNQTLPLSPQVQHLLGRA